MITLFRIFVLLIATFLAGALAGCAQSFPRPDSQPRISGDSLNGQQIFDKSFFAHGGDNINQVKAVNMGMHGEWGFWVTRIQPLVSDYKYRVTSREKLTIGNGGYEANYTGPSGTKVVKRTSNSIEVFYNDIKNEDADVLSSSAMTADGFYLFALGPLAFVNRNVQFKRISDGKISGQSYYRIYARLAPGFGFSEEDEVLLWIDTETFLVKRYGITLNGFRTTQRAWVDVTINDHQTVGEFIFPKELYERVRAPIAIGAHHWEYLDLSIDSIND